MKLNNKIIILEGPQGVGKTTITDYIRNRLSYTNLYRLCGTSDTTITGKKKAEEMYKNLLEYIKKMENKNINLLFDRLFFTEEVYCRLKKKDYQFTDVYIDLVERLFNMKDFDFYYITLFLDNEEIYKERLNRQNKAKYKNSDFNIENSKRQQLEYLRLFQELKDKWQKENIHFYNINTNQNKEDIFKIVDKIFDI